MNIFYLDHNVEKCAEYHNNRHCVKMILEYAQLLSTAHRLIDGEDCDDTVYKATHKNHPSAIWARENAENYNWLYSLFEALCNEYEYRYDKTHLSWTKLGEALKSPPKNIPRGKFYPPTPAMPDVCKLDNSLDSYRNYYITKKKHLFGWKDRLIPEWWVDC